MGFGDYVIEKALADVGAESWVALNFDDPEVAGGEATEITGTGYIRQLASFSDIANRSMWVIAPLSWQGLPQTRVTHVSGWTGQYGGSLQWSGPLPAPVRILEGKGYIIQANEIVLSFA